MRLPRDRCNVAVAACLSLATWAAAYPRSSQSNSRALNVNGEGAFNGASLEQGSRIVRKETEVMTDKEAEEEMIETKGSLENGRVLMKDGSTKKDLLHKLDTRVLLHPEKDGQDDDPGLFVQMASKAQNMIQQLPIPGKLGGLAAAGAAAAANALGLVAEQYIVWAPPEIEVPEDELMGTEYEGKGGVVTGLVSDAVLAARKAAAAAAAAPKFCLTVNEDVPWEMGQIQIMSCDKASFYKSQFWLPEPGTVGPIKQKGNPANCVGVDPQWWGTGATDRTWPNFMPNPLIITPCKEHVSEHNHSWLMPERDVNGTVKGLIAWATHPWMCMDLQDHLEQVEKESEDQEGLLETGAARGNLTRRSKPKKKHDDMNMKDMGETQNVRTFDGNHVTLAPCERIGNWSLMASMPMTLLGSASAVKDAGTMLR